jgi:hypothetical protein
MIGNGVFEEEIEGEKIGFHFGTLSGFYTEEKSGKGINRVVSDISKGQTLMNMAFYFYGGAKAYCEYKGIQRDITIPLISTWMDKIGAEKCYYIFSESLKTISKNGKALETQGLKTEV